MRDHPYVIDGDNRDPYLVTGPFNWFPAGDVDGDRDVDIFDLVTITSKYGQQSDLSP